VLFDLLAELFDAAAGFFRRQLHTHILALLEAVFQSVNELGELRKDDEGADGDEQRRDQPARPRRS
jgi:hypothetical protein